MQKCQNANGRSAEVQKGKGSENAQERQSEKGQRGIGAKRLQMQKRKGQSAKGQKC